MGSWAAPGPDLSIGFVPETCDAGPCCIPKHNCAPQKVTVSEIRCLAPNVSRLPPPGRPTTSFKPGLALGAVQGAQRSGKVIFSVVSSGNPSARGRLLTATGGHSFHGGGTLLFAPHRQRCSAETFLLLTIPCSKVRGSSAWPLTEHGGLSALKQDFSVVGKSGW